MSFQRDVRKPRESVDSSWLGMSGIEPSEWEKTNDEGPIGRCSIQTTAMICTGICDGVDGVEMKPRRMKVCCIRKHYPRVTFLITDDKFGKRVGLSVSSFSPSWVTPVRSWLGNRRMNINPAKLSVKQSAHIWIMSGFIRQGCLIFPSLASL